MAENSRGAAGTRAAEDASERLIRALRDPACYPHETAGIELVETHISWVLLTGPYAYKIKKPLALPFLDFSTLAQRRRFCGEELRLNRRLAPDLYLDVVPIGGSAEAPRVGAEPAIEYAVKLRQFGRDATADRRLEGGGISSDQVGRLAELLARFHARLPAAEGAPVSRLAGDNIAELERVLEAARYRYPLAALRDWTETQSARLHGRLEARIRDGAMREAHGDLHLENLVVVDGELLPFDALEFDAAMRTVDVLDEAAFLVMDFEAHGRADLGFEFLNRYLEITGDYPGVRLMRFYVVYRALVRAKVRAIKAAQPHAERTLDDGVRPYLRLAAEKVADERRPLLLITHGLSGSGKTTVTRPLIPRLPALRLRSDIERKRLHGVDAAEHGRFDVGTGRYDPASTEMTYRTLARFAEDVLAGGVDVIVDATFLTRASRSEFRALAERRGAGFAILDCGAPEATLRRRVEARAEARSDASEATAAVLRHQLEHVEPVADDEAPLVRRVDTSADVDYDALCETLLESRKSATNAAR